MCAEGERGRSAHAREGAGRGAPQLTFLACSVASAAGGLVDAAALRAAAAAATVAAARRSERQSRAAAAAQLPPLRGDGPFKPRLQ